MNATHARTAPAKTTAAPARAPERTTPESPISSGSFDLPVIARCACGGSCPKCSKTYYGPLAGKSDDLLEREADNVADQLTQVTLPATASKPAKSTGVGHDASGHILSLPPSARSSFGRRFNVGFPTVRFHTDAEAAETTSKIDSRAFTTGYDIFFGRDELVPETLEGRRLIAHELTHVAQNAGGAPRKLRRKANDARCSRVRIVLPNTILFEGNRGTLSASISTSLLPSQQPYVIGYNPREDQFFISPGEKTILMNVSLVARPQRDIDLYIAYRNSLASHQASLVVIANPGQQTIDALPPEVRKLLLGERKSETINSSDTSTILRIAEKIESLTLAELADYQNRATSQTNDWSDYELSIDRFLAEQKNRHAITQVRAGIEARLSGLDDLYARYCSYKSTLSRNAALAGRSPQGAGTVIGSQPSIAKMRNELDADLIKARISGGIIEFETLIHDYERVFEQETRFVAKAMLDQYEHLLWTQERRYKQSHDAAELQQSIGKTGARREYEKADKIREQHAQSIVLTPDEMGEQAHWSNERNIALARGDRQVRSVADAHPLVQNSDFDRKRLALASKDETKPLMLGYIAARRKDITTIRKTILEKPDIIYGLDSLLAASFEIQNIPNGTLFDKIIRNRIEEVHWSEVIPQAILTSVAIAAGLLTGGSGALAVLGAGTALGIGVYQAVEEFQRYETKAAARGAQLTSTDPSMAWVVVAVIGAGFDATVFLSVLSKLRPALEAFNAGVQAGNISALDESLKMARLAGAEEEIARAIMRAAEAEVQSRAAWKAVLRPPAALRMVLIPGAEEFGRFVYAVYRTMKRGIRRSDMFEKTIEAVDLIGDITKLSSEQRAALRITYRKAVEEVEAIVVHGKSAGMTEDEIHRFMRLRANTPGMTGKQVVQEMNALRDGQRVGMSVDVTEKQWERLLKVSEALKDETKWVNVTAKDRWRLGRVYDNLLEKLVGEAVRSTGQTVLHFAEINRTLIAKLRQSGGRVLITEGRLPTEGLRLDMLEIDFVKQRAELIDIAATSSARHIEKTRAGKEAIEKLLGMPVDAKELYYTGSNGELLEPLIELTVKSSP